MVWFSNGPDHSKTEQNGGFCYKMADHSKTEHHSKTEQTPTIRKRNAFGIRAPTVVRITKIRLFIFEYFFSYLSCPAARADEDLMSIMPGIFSFFKSVKAFKQAGLSMIEERNFFASSYFLSTLLAFS